MIALRAAPPGSAERARIRAELRSRYGLEFAKIKRKERLVRRGEIVAIDMSPAAARMARQMGFRWLRRKSLPVMGLRIDMWRPPAKMSLEVALAKLQAADRDGRYELNSAFEPSGNGTMPEGALPKFAHGHFKIGMIDTGVLASHPALEEASVAQKNFGRGEAITERDHGTAIASLLAQYGTADIKVADVFSGDAAYSDAEAIVLAMEWLAGEGVAVMNLSLAGPDSLLLELATEKLTSKGYVIVAAVGNDGPDGVARYPAAYDGVIGVTAVDNSKTILEHANQGSFVDYAAVGVNIEAASMDGAKPYSGTSFAVPIIAAQLALEAKSPDPASLMAILDLLEKRVEDLGIPGRDPVYGKGLVPRTPPEVKNSISGE
ncbi:MAG: S8 family serine peptidase [Alphaproteobacteria bacterium]|nr:S8 family serine peptidase [Alphaproteobacteria bacterium]